jgi:hypothetical protein
MHRILVSVGIGFPYPAECTLDPLSLSLSQLSLPRSKIRGPENQSLDGTELEDWVATTIGR